MPSDFSVTCNKSSNPVILCLFIFKNPKWNYNQHGGPPHDFNSLEVMESVSDADYILKEKLKSLCGEEI
jgi:hypothetical protein